MISYQDALSRIVNSAWVLPAETVPLADAQGRVLAELVQSDLDMPPFDKSSMDGYACREADLPGELTVVDHIPAGKMPTCTIGAGQCAKIMTGAPVPQGADCVIIVEEVEETGPSRIRFTGEAPKRNIVPRGDDIRTGDTVLDRGLRLHAQHMPILAAVGRVRPQVHTRPRVAILSTGDELVPVESTPEGPQIRNSNSFQLAAQAQDAGAVVQHCGIVPDLEARQTAAFADALAVNDVVLSTGGVSMGDYDLMPGIIAAHGLEILVRKVAIQPGKPIVFAVAPGKAVFGLSGNPVSSFLQMELFVKPFLRRMQGETDRDRTVHLPLAESMTRKSSGRMAWFPVALRGDQIVPIPFHGSAHVFALANADGLAAYPGDQSTLAAGAVLPVHLIR